MNNKTELRAAAARLLYNDNRDTSDYNMLIDFIDNYFDNQQPKVEQGWIPCSSGKMPPINKDVLITYKYEKGIVVRDLAYLGKDGEWHNKIFGLELFSDRVTAWQPLPQPYKESD